MSNNKKYIISIGLIIGLLYGQFISWLDVDENVKSILLYGFIIVVVIIGIISKIKNNVN